METSHIINSDHFLSDGFTAWGSTYSSLMRPCTASSSDSSSTQASSGSCISDPVHYPTSNDCLLGRGGESNNHSGNVIFRGIIEAAKPTYRNAPRSQKQQIVKNIVARWRGLDPPGRFLAKDSTKCIVDGDGKSIPTYFDVGDEAARKRTAKALSERIKVPLGGASACASNSTTTIITTTTSPSLPPLRTLSECPRSPSGRKEFDPRHLLSRIFACNPIEPKSNPKKSGVQSKNTHVGRHRERNATVPSSSTLVKSRLNSPSSSNDCIITPGAALDVFVEENGTTGSSTPKDNHRAPPPPPKEPNKFQLKPQAISQVNDKKQENLYPIQDEKKQIGFYVADLHIANLMTRSPAGASPWAPPTKNPSDGDKIEEGSAAAVNAENVGAEGSSVAFNAENVAAEAFLDRLKHLPAAADLVKEVIFP